MLTEFDLLGFILLFNGFSIRRKFRLIDYCHLDFLKRAVGFTLKISHFVLLTTFPSLCKQKETISPRIASVR